ncbi:hypothetical protein LEM8419_03284 [Neolewinella maritima]|uniref:DUF3995 domain-containing protein n=1 Tax=Neolewinella maritima TaxID=1383882 RepID=A0ABM9B625_9BACT|nr:hypothetical protein [Neolewinella maritima]CAH1002382.1 hypothetical protein LEM8419_03284 [Neolewinella maritima]
MPIHDPHPALDHQLLVGARPVSGSTRWIRAFTICCVALVIAQCHYSFFTNLAVHLTGPPGSFPLLLGILALLTGLAFTSIPPLYRWRSLGWYLAVGLFAFQGSFLALLSSRYVLYGEPFSWTDFTATYLQPWPLFEICFVLFICCLPLALCWSPAVRAAFGVHRGRAVLAVVLGVVARLALTYTTRLIFLGI